jgi:hypothetical protein
MHASSFIGIGVYLTALIAQATPFDLEQWGSNDFIVADMHDGDQKHLVISNDGKLTIMPHGNNESWSITTTINNEGTAVVDFNVDGKPNPPPVKLDLTFFFMENKEKGTKKMAAEFTDPSGTLADPTFPLNVWIELPVSSILSGRTSNRLRSKVTADPVSINCSPPTWLANSIKMTVINGCNDNVKVRTCNADVCAGSGTKARNYIDCAQHIDKGTTALLTMDEDIHYISFIDTKTGKELVESWPDMGKFPGTFDLTSVC